jgi:hypothetical protein
VKCNAQRRSSRSKPNWDLVRGGGGGAPSPPAQDTGSSYGSNGGSSYGSESYGSSNGSSSYGNSSYGGGSSTKPANDSYGNGSSSYGGGSYSARAAPAKEPEQAGGYAARRRSSTRTKTQKGRFRGMDAGQDLSDDQVLLEYAACLEPLLYVVSDCLVHVLSVSALRAVNGHILTAVAAFDNVASLSPHASSC